MQILGGRGFPDFNSIWEDADFINICFEVKQLFSCSILKIVGILTCMSMINATSQSLKARKKYAFYSLIVFISSCIFMLS